MNPAIYIIFGILLIALLAVLYFVFDLRKKTQGDKDSETLKMMVEWMRDIKKDIGEDRELTQKNIHETNKQINDRLTEAARVIGGLQGKLGEMSQIGPDIRRLSEVLASPKARGNFGEEMLENMLAQVLPVSAYKSQYKFKNGEVVDMIMYVNDKILSIDSKFSMENYRLFREAQEDDAAENLKKAFLRDVKKRIDEIHKKYILPQEGTFDFALMYIPSEGVFQEAAQDLATSEYARDKRVYMVSPNTFYSYLQIVLVAMRGREINRAAEEILRMISGIKQESDKFGKNLGVLANHIKNAGNSMGTVGNDFAKLQSSIANASTIKLEKAAEIGIENETQKLIE